MAFRPKLTPNEFDDACLAAVLHEPEPAEAEPTLTADLVESPAPVSRVTSASTVRERPVPDEIGEQIERLNSALQAARTELAQRDRARQAAETQLESLQGGVAERDDELTELRRQVDGRESEIEALRSKVAEHSDGASDALQREQEARVAAQSRVAELEAELARRDERESELRRDIQERDNAMTRLREAFDALKQDTDRLLKEISTSFG